MEGGSEEQDQQGEGPENYFSAPCERVERQYYRYPDHWIEPGAAGEHLNSGLARNDNGMINSNVYVGVEPLQ